MVSYRGPDGKLSAWPMVWPESATDRWLNRLIEDRAVHVAAVDPGNLTPFIERNLRAIDGLVAKIARPGGFEHSPANPGIVNKDQARWPPQNWQPVLERGVYGGRLDLKDPGLEVFRDHVELVAFFANVLSAGQQLAGRK